MSLLWRIVETDNLGGDDPDESFLGPLFWSKERAERVANLCNEEAGDDAKRFWKVVEEGYTLAPGFEP